MPSKSMPSHPLWELAVGDSREIVSVGGDTADDAVQRLIDIGFREGQQVTCVMQPGFGAPRVYAIGGATYSLDKQTANIVRIAGEADR
jgi:ferrous iron transport protein A